MSIRHVWKLANDIIRTGRMLVNEGLGHLNLNSSEGAVLLNLLIDGDNVTQDEIAGKLEISKPAVTKALNALEQKGYVIRKRSPTDKRVNLVTLTARAREIGPEVERVYDQVFLAAARGITDEQIESFIELFHKVATNLSHQRDSGLNQYDKEVDDD